MHTGRLLRIPSCAVVMVGLFSGPVQAEGRVQLELVGDSREAALALQEWGQALSKAGVGNVRLRSGQSTDKVAVEVQGTAAAPLYIVTGIVKSRDELLLPGAQFRRRDVARLARWLDDLAKNGPADRREPKAAFGMTQSQLESLRQDLAPMGGFSTLGMTRAEAIARLSERVPLPLKIDPDAAPGLREDKIAEELSGLSCGTALACILRPAGCCLVPREEKGDSPHLCDDHASMVPASGPFRQMGTVPFFLRVVKARPDLQIWPVGWPPQKLPRDALPALMEFHNVNIAGVSATTALEAIGKELKVPVLLDHNALARHGIDPSQVSVKHPQGRTTYSIALRKILFQARLQFEVRVDEAGRPFLWVTTLKPV